MANPYHYRNKNQIVFKNAKGGKCRIASGFYKENTHNIVDFDTCLIQDEISDKIVKIIKELMLKMHYNAYDEDHQNGLIRHVLIKRSEVTKEIMVVIVTAQEVFPGCQNFVKALIAREKNITTIIQNINQRKTSAVLGDKKFNISAKSFYQVNSASCANLYKEAIRLAGLSKNDVLLDAYCGVGTIGIIASDYVGKVVSVELVKDAVYDAIKNAKMNNIKNIHFFCADASDFIKNLAAKKEKIDVIIMDPPRKGSDERFINAVLKLMPKKVIYISCNPHTLVNDLKYFKGAYSIKAIQPVDMFPHTYHIETIVLLQKTQK
jgi:23S rRNA (uracil1939-C5)-methyltransferase